MKHRFKSIDGAVKRIRQDNRNLLIFTYLIRQMAEKKIEQKIYETCKRIGETCEGILHIIYHKEDFYGDEGFRVYHKNGFCFDSKRSVNENGRGFQYNYYAEWEGFYKLKPEHALQLLRNPRIAIFQ